MPVTSTSNDLLQHCIAESHSPSMTYSDQEGLFELCCFECFEKANVDGVEAISESTFGWLYGKDRDPMNHPSFRAYLEIKKELTYEPKSRFSRILGVE